MTNFESREITKQIVIAMIQGGLLLPEKRQGTEKWNTSSIEIVKTAFNEIHETVKDRSLTNKPE